MSLRLKQFKRPLIAPPEVRRRRCRDFVAALTSVYNLILQGKGGNPDIWIRARIVALPKAQGGVRPIAVGEVITRLMNRALAADLGAVIGKKMAPLQWGVGVRGGAEVVSPRVQLAHDAILTALDGRPEDGAAGAGTAEHQERGQEEADPLTIWSTDIANAFNELRRRATSDALLDSVEGRSLVRLFHWSYGKKAALLHGDGTVACYSETGMRQGDPLGPLFFSLDTGGQFSRTRPRNSPMSPSSPTSTTRTTFAGDHRGLGSCTTFRITWREWAYG